MQDFRRLDVWRMGHELTLAIHRTTKKFPPEEKYELGSQLRRAAASIPTNLAEGCGRGSDADFARFVQNALGSASEVDYQLILSHDLGYLDAGEAEGFNDTIQSIKRMLIRLLQTLRK